MGSVCCVAARERNLPSGSGNGAARNQGGSQRWSFRRDNRRRVADGIEDAPQSARGGFSGGLATSAFQKSANSGVRRAAMIPLALMRTSLAVRSPSDVSLASPVRARVEVRNVADSPEMISSALPKPSSSTSVCPLPLALTHSLPPRSTTPGRVRGSPEQQLQFFRQVSDSLTMGLKSPNACSTSEGRSHCASSEGSVDEQTCGFCSKLLTGRSSTVRFDLPVAAVLSCGHVYHAECLETMTGETERYDPMCPICTVGEEQVAEVSRKILKAEAESKAKNYKRYKNRVVDSEYNELRFKKMEERERKALKMDPSLTTKASSSKSFLERHFGSFNSKWSKPMAGDSSSKKSFWSRQSNKRLSYSSSI